MAGIKINLGRAKGRRLIVTALAATASLLVMTWIAGKLTSRKDFAITEPRYLITRRALPQGNPAHFLDLTAVPRSQVEGDLPAGALTDQDLHLVKGATFRQAMAARSFITVAMLHLSANVSHLGSTIPKGLRAYSLRPANELKVAPGDRVDIFVNPADARELPIILADGAPVLQAGTRDGIFEVVAAVSAEQVEWLEKGKQRGKLNIALLNPQDRSTKNSTDAARLWLQKSNRRKVAPRRIEVWAEDR